MNNDIRKTLKEIRDLELRLQELERMERNNLWLLLLVSFVLTVVSYGFLSRLWN